MREWLKKLREDNNLTMKKLGEKLGISESYYFAIEKGERQKKMDIVLITSLSQALNVSIAEIVESEFRYLSEKKNSFTDK